ncbi:pyridoxamine 5'-phosphate oxidase family protein [Paenibacillus tuaregi]|uniref:pyridoxamine 5'-phosphate oxidase family protein n=1 Tax=Paenibacillus tuaregi TaxID=1816681 RepID=UPI000838A39A|nr:pyridoxamine 5'-phosphate oxidase family protein [Paenibacillus tuaregi]
MDRQQLESKIEQALQANKFGSLATVENGGPKVRYMAIYHEGLSIYLATDRKTHKVEELKNNPKAALLLGYEQGGTGDVVEIEGEASVSDAQDLKSKVWRDDFKPYLSGPDDPDYVVIKLTPSRIEFAAKGSDRQVWTADK